MTGILNAVGGRQVSYALDAVSQGGTISTLANVLLKTSPDGKGKIATVLPPSEEERKQIPESVSVNFHQVSSAYGEDEERKGLSLHNILPIIFILIYLY